MINKVNELNKREKQVFSFIRAFKKKTGAVPSARQICYHLGFKSSRSAQIYITTLKDKGFLMHRKPETSSYLLAEEQSGASAFDRIPFLGAIAAGAPSEAFVQSDRMIELPCGFFGAVGDELFALQIMGNSMSGDYICEGDVAIVRKQTKGLQTKDILAVRVGSDEFTLKRLHRKRNIVELLPSNPQYKVMSVPAEQVEIVGKYLGLLRRSTS
ncbi:MAG: repressor LexA [Deltaproteobacteria bacterium]|nr:repressor LexA [Deltaproteobacteria bacterium]